MSSRVVPAILDIVGALALVSVLLAALGAATVLSVSHSRLLTSPRLMSQFAQPAP